MSLIDKIVTQTKDLLVKAEQAIEGERYIPISQATVNGLLERYVVGKVSEVIKLKADIDDHDFKLEASIEAKGIIAEVSGTFEVVSFIFNDHIQHLIFKQTDGTHIDKIAYEKVWMQPVIKLALLYLKFFLKKDLLCFALEKFEVASCHDDVLTFDLNKYFDEDGTILRNLKRFHVTDAKIESGKLQLLSRINMSGFFPNAEDEMEDNTILVSETKPENNRLEKQETNLKVDMA